MTVWTQEADLPWIELPGGFQLVFEAISPTTGAAITGCTVSNVALYGLNIAATLGKLEDVIPGWTSEEVGQGG